MNFQGYAYYRIKGALRILDEDVTVLGHRRFCVAPRHKRRDFKKSKKMQNAVNYLISKPVMPGKPGTP